MCAANIIPQLDAANNNAANNLGATYPRNPKFAKLGGMAMLTVNGFSKMLTVNSKSSFSGPSFLIKVAFRLTPFKMSRFKCWDKMNSAGTKVAVFVR